MHQFHTTYKYAADCAAIYAINALNSLTAINVTIKNIEIVHNLTFTTQ